MTVVLQMEPLRGWRFLGGRIGRGEARLPHPTAQAVLSGWSGAWMGGRSRERSRDCSRDCSRAHPVGARRRVKRGGRERPVTRLVRQSQLVQCCVKRRLDFLFLDLQIDFLQILNSGKVITAFSILSRFKCLNENSLKGGNEFR